jgi:hypothetical protein
MESVESSWFAHDGVFLAVAERGRGGSGEGFVGDAKVDGVKEW